MRSSFCLARRKQFESQQIRFITDAEQKELIACCLTKRNEQYFNQNFIGEKETNINDDNQRRRELSLRTTDERRRPCGVFQTSNNSRCEDVVNKVPRVAICHNDSRMSDFRCVENSVQDVQWTALSSYNIKFTPHCHYFVTLDQESSEYVIIAIWRSLSRYYYYLEVWSRILNVDEFWTLISILYRTERLRAGYSTLEHLPLA